MRAHRRTRTGRVARSNDDRPRQPRKASGVYRIQQARPVRGAFSRKEIVRLIRRQKEARMPVPDGLYEALWRIIDAETWDYSAERRVRILKFWAAWIERQRGRSERDKAHRLHRERVTRRDPSAADEIARMQDMAYRHGIDAEEYRGPEGADPAMVRENVMAIQHLVSLAKEKYGVFVARGVAQAAAQGKRTSLALLHGDEYALQVPKQYGPWLPRGARKRTVHKRKRS